MAQLEIDRFTEWVKSVIKSNLQSICGDIFSDDEVLSLTDVKQYVDYNGKQRFHNVGIQAQWEAWQAALVDRPTLRPMSTAPNDGTPILVRLEKESLWSLWHVARIRPKMTVIGHEFGFDCPPMVGWLPLPVIVETEVPDASK